jgi:hypothetical protein
LYGLLLGFGCRGTFCFDGGLFGPPFIEESNLFTSRIINRKPDLYKYKVVIEAEILSSSDEMNIS